MNREFVNYISTILKQARDIDVLKEYFHSVCKSSLFSLFLNLSHN